MPKNTENKNRSSASSKKGRNQQGQFTEGGEAARDAGRKGGRKTS